MFIRKAAFEYLVKRSESQQQQIDKLSEMVGILAKFCGQQLDLDFGNHWNLEPASDDPINARRQDAPSADWSF